MKSPDATRVLAASPMHEARSGADSDFVREARKFQAAAKRLS